MRRLLGALLVASVPAFVAAQTPLAFTQLFTAGAARGGKLAEPSREFTPDERTIHLRFAYEGGIAGEELRSRWVWIGPGGPQEIAQSTLRLKKTADRGQFSFSPAEGARWREGAYRVEIVGRGAVLGQADFVVQAARAAAPPPAIAGRVSVVEAVLAKDVEQGQPKDPVTEFSAVRKRLILWARVGAPGGGALTARWYATDGGDRLLGEHTLAVPAGENRVAYWLEVADDKTKFPRGGFRVDLLSAGQTVKQVPFHIRPAGFFEEVGEAFEQLGRELDKAISGSGSAPTPPPPTPAPQVASAPPPPPPAKTFRDATFGVELELPAGWTYRLTPNKDYLFEGPQGTDAYELAIVLQFVSKAKAPGSSAEAQAEGLARQIRSAPDGKLVTSDTAAIAGQPAPYFVASYTAPDSRKVATAFAHTQIVMDHGAYYYLLSYSGPAPIYQKHLATFQHVVETFRFVK